MTLLVGAVFPWESLFEHLIFRAAAQLGLVRGVILAADSRWTRPSGAQRDSAVKLYQVGTNGLAVYAGSVAAGEDAIQELSTRLPGRPVSTMDEMNAIVTQALQTVWARYAVLGQTLHVLLGMSDRHGGCWLGGFSEEDGFRARSLTDIALVGPEPAKDHFRKVLHDITAEQLKGPSFDVSLESWATVVAAALHDTCEKQADALVGGQIMCGVTSAGQARGQGLYRLQAERIDLGAQRLTVDPLQAHTLRRWWKYHPPAGDQK